MNLKPTLAHWWEHLRGRQGAATRRTASGTALSLVAGVLVVAAVQADGFPISEVDLNDGSVWVTKDDDGIVGRLNTQVQELDMGVLSRAARTDLHQDAADVQVIDLGGGGDRQVLVLDVVGGKVGVKVELPKEIEVSSGRRTIALLDPRSGKGWVRAATALDGFTLKEEPTLTGLGQGGLVLVGANGTAHFLNRSTSTVTPVRLNVAGTPVVGEPVELKAELGDDVAMTAVGNRPIVLDRSAATIHQPGGATSAIDDPKSARLQSSQPGQADDFHVATSAGLWRGSASGGDLTKVSSVRVSGPPAAPAVVDGCVYGAWRDLSAKENFERVCGDDSVAKRIPRLSATAELAFRVNRKIVVLNDAAGGISWLVQAGMEIIENWDSVDPRKKQKQQETQTRKKPDPNRNEPPVAKDDKDFGARPGSTVVIPVTVNDNDPDGDILTVSPNLETDDRDLELSVVGNGTQVQARIGPNARGSVSFTYAVTDGQPDHAESEATVVIPIVEGARDDKPVKFPQRDNTLIVAKGHEAHVNVLPAWYDPDGDPLVLTGATSDGGEVFFRPDGTITFRDNGAGRSTKSIDFEVTGGTATARGKVSVTVVAPAKAAPNTIPDRVTGVAGSAILVDPLANDSDPLGGSPRLLKLDPVAANKRDVVVTRDAEKGTGTVMARRPGSYYLTYVAGNDSSAQSAPESVRVDVVAVGGTNRPPVADRDTAVLTSGSSALVDVLANDSHPDGDVLIVRGFGTVSDGVKASLINQRFVRVEASGPLTGTSPEITYHLTDGEHQVDGTIAVSQTEGDQNRPPVAIDDQVTARAGSLITLPVLANDTDPDGDPLTVHGQDLELPEDVPVVATGTSLRVLVPNDGRSELEFAYTVRDTSQASDTGRVVVNIVPDSPKGNQAPHPSPVESRAVSGQKVRIPLSAFDADPDGDPVSFSRVEEQPTLGRIVSTGVDWVEYEPKRDAVGTDAFTVSVSDQYGATGRLDVRVGVAKREPVNQPPTALDDVIFVKPGRTIQYAVLSNDSDADGDPLVLLPDLGVANTEAEVVDGFVELTSPRLDGMSQRIAAVSYGVTDGLGAISRARLTVTSSDLAPDHAPLATDDPVPASEVAGKKPGDTHRVDVLANDGDIDGAREDLRIEALTAGSTVVDGELQVTLAASDQVVPYRLIDGDGQTAYGFVYLSGTENLAPVLDETKVPIEVTAGHAEEIDLRDIVLVRAGHEPRIYRQDQITVVNGDGSDPAKDDHTLVFRAPKRHYGTASIMLQVTDGQSVNDKLGLVSQISVPIEVAPAGNVAPDVRSTAVDILAGGAAATIDLNRLASDPNGDDLSFSVKEQGKGVSAKIDDEILTIKAAADAPSADGLELKVTADDGKKKASGTVYVRVIGVSADRGEDGPADDVPETPDDLLMVASPIKVDASAGKSVEIDVAGYVIQDPYPDKPKKLTDVSASAGGTASAKGTTLQVTPGKGFSGVLVVNLKVDDGSGDAARRVPARVEVTVAAAPDAPGRPQASAQSPSVVRVDWAAPADNGKPITEYELTWNGGKKSCPGTQCVVDGLDPGTEYSFSVRARNEVDWGKPSPKSAPLTPDEVPDRMEAPTIDPATAFPMRDQKLKVTWVAPKNTGSAITKYEVEQAPGSVKTFGATTLASEFTGLANGTSHRFRARAVNARGEGAWSNWSTDAVPFTKPGPVSGVTIHADAPDGSGDGHISTSWLAPVVDGGDPDGIARYQVEVWGDGAKVAEKAVTGTSTDFTVANGKVYSVQVRAENNAGSADEFVKSDAVTVYDLATAPTNLRRSGDDRDKAGTLAFRTPANNGGFPVTKYLIETQDGWSRAVAAPTTAQGAETTLPVTFTANHSSGQWVRLTPITQPTGHGDVTGTRGQSGADFRPFGKPGAPGSNGSTSGYKSTTIRWTAGTANGRPIERTEIRGDATGSFGAGGSRAITTTQGGDRKCIQARAQAGGLWSDWSGSLCGTAQPRTVTVRFSNIGGSQGACSSNCKWIRFSVEGFRAGTFTVNASQAGVGGGTLTPHATISVGSNGRADFNGNWYYTGLPGRVTITVDGASGSATP